MKKKGFTLAEVLITLGIIGVVAAMTIPNLINAHKAARYRSQFLKSYSTIQQALRLMSNDDLSLDFKDYKPNKFYITFKNYFKGAVDCGNSDTADMISKKIHNCWYWRNSNDYVSYSKKNMRTDWLDDGQIALPDGTNIYIENLYESFISVDINGFVNPPNRWGVDLFTFQLVNGELRAVGDLKTKFPDSDKYCNPTGTERENGISCTIKAINDPNYIKKAIKNVK